MGKQPTVEEDAEALRKVAHNLTMRQARFIAHYLRHGNATKAHAEAFPGNALSTSQSQGSRMLRKRWVKEAIEAAKIACVGEAFLDYGEKRKLLAKIARHGKSADQIRAIALDNIMSGQHTADDAKPLADILRQIRPTTGLPASAQGFSSKRNGWAGNAVAGN